MKEKIHGITELWKHAPLRYKIEAGIIPLEVLFITVIYREWGPMMTMFIAIVNAAFIIAIYQIIPLVSEYLEEDAEKDAERITKAYAFVGAVAEHTAIMSGKILAMLIISLSGRHVIPATESARYYQSLYLQNPRYA